MTNEKLIELAYEATKKAYTPYSNFQVGAALLAASGKVYTGCNIENASFGATNCAERTAIFKAVSEGEREFVKMAVVSHTHKHTFPCGICRQVMGEFLYQGTLVFDDDEKGIIEVPVREILPYKFDLVEGE